MMAQPRRWVVRDDEGFYVAGRLDEKAYWTNIPTLARVMKLFDAEAERDLHRDRGAVLVERSALTRGSPEEGSLGGPAR